MKRFIALSLSALAISTCAPTFAAESVKASINEAPVYFNGEKVTESEDYPFLNYNGVIYMPLTFENADSLDLETDWSDEVGLNVSSDGEMYTVDSDFIEINSLAGMPLSDLERKFATDEKRIVYSGGLEMGADGYVTDDEKIDPFALDADFLKYYCIQNNRVHATEYSSYDLRGSNAGEALYKLVQTFGAPTEIIMGDDPLTAESSLDDWTFWTIQYEATTEAKLVWETPEGTRTVRYFGNMRHENGRFHITFEPAQEAVEAKTN